MLLCPLEAEARDSGMLSCTTALSSLLMSRRPRDVGMEPRAEEEVGRGLFQ